MMKFRVFPKWGKSYTVTFIPRDKIPEKNKGGRPKRKIDHYDFKGEYNITVLKIGNKGLPNPNNDKYYKKGGDIQEWKCF